MHLIELCQLLEYYRPTPCLLLRVFDPRNRIAVPVVVGYLGELFAPLPVDGVLEALYGCNPDAEVGPRRSGLAWARAPERLDIPEGLPLHQVTCAANTAPNIVV